MNSPRLPKPVSEAKRERDIARFYGACIRNVPHFEPDSGHVPRPARDSALTAFAQLAAVRLGARRALISLIDDQHEYILAEATQTMSLRFTSQLGASDDLWLGSVAIPRAWGISEHMLSIDPAHVIESGNAVVVINDLTRTDKFASRDYVQDGQARFYAGVALTSPNGAIVGAACVLDDEPRDGLSQDDIFYLQDLGTTIAEYLETYMVKDQFRRGEQLTRGLISFSEGKSALQDFHDQTQGTEPPPSPSPTPLAGRSQPGQYPFPKSGKASSVASSSTVQAAQSIRTSRHNSVKALQDSILPMNSKTMFARAASIIRSSSDVDGVIILDASIAATRQRHHGEDESLASEGDSALESSRSKSSSEDDSQRFDKTLPPNSGSGLKSTKQCGILGLATLAQTQRTGAGPDPEIEYKSFLERDLAHLLRKFPNGKILQFNADGDPTSSTDDSDSTKSSNDPNVLLDQPTATPTTPAPKQQGKSVRRSRRSFDVVSGFLPKARNVAFIPFWDYERSRWFAGCLCWSNNADRIMSSQIDLAYFKVFGSTIMTELSRLDAIASSQSKTTFVASISHELRSPLHGILGTLQFMQDTLLDSFQVTLLNSMSACGTTLLDTIDHVLDYSKMNETERSVSTKRLRDLKTIRLSAKPVKSRHALTSASHDAPFNLALATEEVVEAVFAGSTPNSRSTLPLEGGIIKRKNCYVVIDLAHEHDWNYSINSGSWRRILMNVFGNALKYTDSGHIRVHLRSSSPSTVRGATQITLTVQDSGSGMSPEFLANKAFQPFSQENPHASGTGLGLSIIRQIIETIGGKVEISSDTSKGTELRIRLALPRPKNPPAETPQRSQFLVALPRLERRRICILHKECRLGSEDTFDLPPIDNGLGLFTDALATTLMKWLKMEVVHSREWEGIDADIVICPEPSFEYLAAIRALRRNRDNKVPVTIFVAMDGLEAATLRCDARVVNKESVVEIMTQPCGPYKLASILNHCLNRYESPDENVVANQTATPSPMAIGGRRSASTRSTPPVASPTDAWSEPSSMAPSPHLSPALSIAKAEQLTGIVSEPGLTERTSSETTGSESIATGESTSLSIRDRLKSHLSHVLITDDNLVNRRLLVAFLKKQQLQYQEAENGLQALQKYQDGSVRFDVILMDVSMPVMDGMTATRHIRAYEKQHNVKRTYIIALTGLASASARLEAWTAGVDHFMTKPIQFKALERLLQDKADRAKKDRITLSVNDTKKPEERVREEDTAGITQAV